MPRPMEILVGDLQHSGTLLPRITEFNKLCEDSTFTVDQPHRSSNVGNGRLTYSRTHTLAFL